MGSTSRDEILMSESGRAQKGGEGGEGSAESVREGKGRRWSNPAQSELLSSALGM